MDDKEFYKYWLRMMAGEKENHFYALKDDKSFQPICKKDDPVTIENEGRFSKDKPMCENCRSVSSAKIIIGRGINDG